MMNRRVFLGQAGLMSAGMLLMPKLLSAKQGGKYGLQLFSLREQLPKDVKGVIGKVAEAGYKQVETFGYSKEHGFWGLSAPEFKKLLKTNGLVSPSGHYTFDSFLSSGQIGDLDDAIDAANILGQEYVVVPYINPDMRKTAADLKSIVNWINIAGDRVQKAGLKLAYHNHNFEFDLVEGQRLYDLILNGTNPELVDLEMDVYWVVRAGQDPLKLIQDHPGRFKLLHVKDMDKSDPKLNTEVGTGSIDYKPIIAAARNAGVKYYIIEQENFKIDPYESITKNNKNLRGLF
ncbi:MAG TPA: sugar phosphate isomerase/epimerase [Mucilaginibacter sp.]|jgi:sugar phosphate isomerase/epimerase|nr:sugar phosphate isomerase/epimerase [Mucilaginibacter sp.]